MRISIVTPSFQQAEFLEETLNSIDSSREEVQHIVVDGGSTDGSKEIIEKHQQALSWWCSEKDEGQSDALNKGIAHCSGDIFNWINSDDLLTPNTLDIVTREFSEDPELLVVGGRVVHRSAEGDRVFEHQTDSSEPDNFFIEHAVLQPATWFKMSVVKEIGGVEARLRYVMDYELWLQFVFRYGVDRIKLIKEPLAIFRLHDDSKTVSAHHGFLEEKASILHALCSKTNSKDLAAILSKGYTIKNGLRNIPVNNADHPKLIRRMTLRFLFKWNAVISEKRQFEMMRALIMSLDPAELDQDEFSRIRFEGHLKNLKAPNWNLFRIKRKLGV